MRRSKFVWVITFILSACANKNPNIHHPNKWKLSPCIIQVGDTLMDTCSRHDTLDVIKK